jgi:hypothetical protein
MAIKLQLRNPDGTYTRGSLVNAEKAFTTFGSKVIQGGRKILNQKQKRAKGTLFSDFHYTLNVKRTSMDMGFEFGRAEKYWEFVNEGVVGVGGFKGSGQARGRGSSFKFKYANPGGKLVKALKSTYGLSTSHAFGAGYNIKRKGLERTQFFTRPLNEQLEKLDKDILSGFAKDVDKLLNNMPEKLVVIK